MPLTNSTHDRNPAGISPVVSIVVVVYNAVSTLEATIQSVIEQSFTARELLIIDGGSTDGTLEILQRWKQHGIAFISEKDEGIYDAMNKGIRMAKGEWIYFLGADDVLYSRDVLQQVFSSSEVAQSDFLYGNVYAEGLNRIYDGEFSKERLLFQNMSHQAVFFRRYVFDKVGLYDSEYPTFADWKLNIECFFHPDIRIKYIPVVIARFAAGGAGTTRPDVHFLRNFLFPFNLKELDNTGISSLKNIRTYDRWWRLIRSMRLKELSSSVNFLHNMGAPVCIQSMYKWQRKMPEAMLWTGVFSKAVMGLHYMYCRMLNRFKESQ